MVQLSLTSHIVCTFYYIEEETTADRVSEDVRLSNCDKADGKENEPHDSNPLPDQRYSILMYRLV